MKFNIEQEDYLIDKFTKIDNINSYNSSFFYGEVDNNDIYNIIIKFIFKEIDCDYKLNFLDIGSGCGKLVIFINEKTNLCCTGVEIIEHRYLKSLQYVDDNNIEFLNDDFKNIYLGNYDIIYCCNLIFSNEDNNLLYFKLNNEFTGYILLFTYNNKIIRNLISEFKVNTSWQHNVPIFLFYF